MEHLDLILLVVFVGVPLVLGFFVGRWAEGRHFKHLDERESQNGDFFVTQIKTCPEAISQGPTPTLLFGESVVACDYFKSFVGKLRNIFGGEVKSYQTLLERARREALQQMVEQAQANGFNAMCNVRYQNADVGGNTATKKGAVMVAILATGTAYCRTPVS